VAGRHRFLRSLFYLFTIAIVFVLVVAAYTWLTEGGLGMFLENAVAVVDVEGVIEDSEDVVAILDRVAENDSLRAVVIRIDSPGGGVAPSQEIYDAVLRVRERKPVVASLGSLAASGGYYVASACHVIVSNPGTLTGSIGVIMQVGNVEELLRKLGLAGMVVKAGRYKDIGSPLRAMSEEERQLLESLLGNIHEQFVRAVAHGRGVPKEKIEPVADGRIYSGEQALELGLVDRLGGLREAVEVAAARAGIEGKPTRIPFRVDQSPWWWRRLSTMLAGRSPGWSGGLWLLYSGPPATG